jgi:hypothetical protein
MDTTDNLDLPYLMPAQAQKHVTHNEALGALDALVQLAVADRDLASPPGSPTDGRCWIVAAAPTGDWAGQAGRIAHRLDGAWIFHTPRPGWVAWVLDEAQAIYWTGSAWASVSAAITALQNLSLLGIGTSADAANPFAAKLNKALWTARTAAEGGDGDLRYTLNKETAADVLSLLMQTGFSGRAEFGLVGDDNLTLKVSPDGSAWTTALSVDRTTGRATLSADPSAPLGAATKQYADGKVARGGDAMTGALELPAGSAAAPGLRVGNATSGLARTASPYARMVTAIDGVEQAFVTRGGRIGSRGGLIVRPNVAQRTLVATRPWSVSTPAADNSWRGICWSAELGLFCAIASSGTGSRVMTSPDGATWTARTSAADNEWYGLCWSPELGLFCAVSITGTGNRVMTSPDGIAWTARTSAADNNWHSVCWSAELGLFCAVSITGAGNRVMTSPDGIAWTARTSAADNNWRGICWSAELGLFCAVASSGIGNRVMTSPDGVTWTTRTTAVSNQWWSVCWSAELGLFCATAITGTGNQVMTSPDGVTWTARTSAADNNWWAVAWSPELGLFCAVADLGTGNRVMTSPDGIVWTARPSAADNSWRGLCWSPELGLFCAVSITGTGNRAMTSQSARALHARSMATVATLPSGVPAGSSIWCSDLGGGGGQLNFDGTSWRRVSRGGQQTVATDVNLTLTTLTNAEEQRHTGTLTANRTITLSGTNAYGGARFRVARSGAGAFTLDFGGLKTLATGTWAEATYDGSAWYLSAYGGL